MLTERTDTLHWTRKQETTQRMVDGVGHVLLVGDSAGAIFPSLGQGANLAIEDACAAATVLRTFTKAAVDAGATRVDVPSATSAIERLRLQRRSGVQAMSRDHARHVAAFEGSEAALQAETKDWMGQEGGRFPVGTWRKRLKSLWRGWPKVKEVEAAVEGEASASAIATAAASADSNVSSVFMQAETATPENFAPFGQVCKPEEDGLPYGHLDAQLDGLDNGIPRLYLMKLDGPRPLVFDRITHHKEVSQCLGAIGDKASTADFYLAVHAPTANGETPTRDGLKAFRIGPGTFVKMHRGTWHAGPLWGHDLERTYYNLELSDTNVVDHHTVRVSDFAEEDKIVIRPPA